MPDDAPPASHDPLALLAAPIVVPRTARYYRLGAEASAAREVWVVCHGYGQLARYFLRPFRSVVGDAFPGRSVVAPEGLSRFYLDSHTGAYDRVGASWMTRDGRLDEIDDQIAYLDAVLAEVIGEREEVRLGVLGFSQGAATASRWIDQSPFLAERSLFPTRFVVWGADLPHDLDLSDAGPRWLNRSDLHLVIGSDDEYATPERTRVARERLDAADIAYQFVPYEGGHRIVPEMLPSVLSPLDG